MPKGFFITGTDTGVGKTIIAGVIIRVLRLMGRKAAGMKPIESGCSRQGGCLLPFDAMSLKQAAHMEEPLTDIAPCCFETPLAPLPASEIEMYDVGIPSIMAAFSKLSQKYETVVVEGIGGLLVPITKDYSVADLAVGLGLPLVVVAKPGLGTINHTMLTVQYALGRGLTVAGVIINYTSPPENSLAEQTNPKVLSQICPAPVIGIFPYMKEITEEAIDRAALKNLDLETLSRYL